MKKQLIIDCPEKGVFMFHAWNANNSFYVMTQRGTDGFNHAIGALRRQYGKIYLNRCCSAVKQDIKYFFQ